MLELLRLLVGRLSFLALDPRYRLADSCYQPQHFGNAYVVMESAVMRWRLVRDRSQIFLEGQPTACDDREWFTVDLILNVAADAAVPSGPLRSDPECAGMEVALEQHVDEIEHAMCDDQLAATLGELRALKRKRSQDLFR